MPFYIDIEVPEGTVTIVAHSYAQVEEIREWANDEGLDNEWRYEEGAA